MELVSAPHAGESKRQRNCDVIILVALLAPTGWGGLLQETKAIPVMLAQDFSRALGYTNDYIY